MIEIFKDIQNRDIIWAIIFGLLLMNFVGCQARENIFTIGIINDIEPHATILHGFKAGLTELGYIEDKNIKYIYNGVIESKEDIIDAEIKNLLSQDIDLFFISGTLGALRANEILKGNDTPIVITGAGEPVEKGLVDSLSQPGGNITGVQLVDTMAKGLEWLAKIAQGLKKVYLPINADDIGSTFQIVNLEKSASQMGIELVLHEIHSVEEMLTAIEKLPEDVDAIYMTPSPFIDIRNKGLSEAAIRRGLPMGSSVLVDESVLISLTSDFFQTGKRLARLAHQIHNGMKPVDFPMEKSEVILTINLKTAERLGIHIPGNILAQANTIIR